MEEYFNNKSIFTLMGKWKIHIILIAIFAAVIAGAASYLITPLYKSTAVLYPVNLGTFSDENETEQMLQFLQSNDIKFQLIEKLNLDKHYNVSKSDTLYKTYMFAKINERISFSKTEFESVKISVLDQVPDTAVMIVNEIIALYNKEVQSLHRNKYKELLDIKQNEIKNKNIELDSLRKRINYLRNEYGLLDYDNQVKELTRVYYKSGSKSAKETLDNLKLHGGEYKKLDINITKEQKVLARIKLEYEKVNTEYHKEITFAHIVEKPFAADKKTKPVRWLIVLLSVIGSVILSMIAITIIESKKTSSK